MSLKSLSFLFMIGLLLVCGQVVQPDAGAEGGAEGGAEQPAGGEQPQPPADTGFASPPPKQQLATQYQTLPSLTQEQPLQSVQPPAVEPLGMQTLPSETLGAQSGQSFGVQPLPTLQSQTSETLPMQTLSPLAATKLPPQMRTQMINQEVIQPIYQTQPYLRIRHITQNVYQPTMQKQPVIQRIITQPILRRTIRQQPIVQQQLQEQTVVKRRVINQPRVVQRLQMQYETAPQQQQEEMGAAYPTQQQPNAKVAAAMGQQFGQAPPADDQGQAPDQGQEGGAEAAPAMGYAAAPAMGYAAAPAMGMGYAAAPAMGMGYAAAPAPAMAYGAGRMAYGAAPRMAARGGMAMRRRF